MTEIYDIQVIKHQPIFSDEFFNNYIKGHNFDLYEVTTNYRQFNEAVRLINKLSKDDKIKLLKLLLK